MEHTNTSDDDSDSDYDYDDDDAVKRFVILNPYPSYEDMLQKIDRRIDLEAEYGTQNHIWCKTIYDNPTNKNLVVETGKAIFTSGGKQALTKNLEIIKCYSPYWNSSFKNQGCIIEKYFGEKY